MSVVFGGKLISHKGQSAVDDFDDPNYGIKLLSKREKTLLAELNKTRSEIVSELVILGPSVATGNLDDWHQTINTYESQIHGSGSFHSNTGSNYDTNKRTKKRSSRNQLASGKLGVLKSSSLSFHESKTTTGLDFLPALATHSVTSHVSSKRRGGSTSQAIRLPILTLPSIQTKHSTSNSPRCLVDDASHQYNPLSDFAEFSGGDETAGRALIILDDLDRYYIQQYLEISNEQMDEILQDLDAILLGGVAAAAGETCDSSRPSVFNAVRDMCFSNDGIEGSSTTVPATSPPLLFEGGKARVQGSSRLLLGSKGAMPHSASSSAGFSRSSALRKTTSQKTSIKGRSSKEVTQKNKKSKMAWSDSGGINDLNSIEALRTELVKSLGNMQHHTAEVKHGILHVQEIVSLTNPKAKTFILTMAADQLFAVIKKVGLRQIRRGWDAWKLNIKNQNLIIKAVLFKRFQHFRNLAILLNKLVSQIIGAKFYQWARYCITMRTHEEMELKTAAVLLVQRVVRGILSRVRVKKLKDNQNFTRMHDSLVKIQALFRCKLQHWKYKKYRRNILEDASARTMQRVVRGHLGRCKACKLRLFQNKELNAVMIQAVVRGLFGRKIAQEERLLRLKGAMALRIQVIARGYNARMRIKKIKRDKIESAAAVSIQAKIRGALARMNLHRRKKEAAEYQRGRNRQAKLIQSVYRGHRARILYRYYMQERNELRALENTTAIILQCFVRCFVARARIRRLREQRFNTLVVNAMAWKEMWAEDTGSWFYFNDQTEEALWEPPAGGYKKNDGQLVLESGEIIDEPDMTGKKKRAAGEEHLCVECVKRVAIRACEECGDGFCTKCYKTTHASGSRKQHTWKPAGPIDCTECEEELAERWCVSCDEAYCDNCWRKVHSKGKRRFHPFSQVQEDGHIDNRIFTIDGEQVSNYDASYAQNRHEDDKQTESNLDAEVQDLYSSMDIQDVVEESNEDFMQEQYNNSTTSAGTFEFAEDDADASTEEEWTQYNDDDGNAYWYNNYTEVSQYEDPYVE